MLMGRLMGRVKGSFVGRLECIVGIGGLLDSILGSSACRLGLGKRDCCKGSFLLLMSYFFDLINVSQNYVT